MASSFCCECNSAFLCPLVFFVFQGQWPVENDAKIGQFAVGAVCLLLLAVRRHHLDFKRLLVLGNGKGVAMPRPQLVPSTCVVEVTC